MPVHVSLASLRLRGAQSPRGGFTILEVALAATVLAFCLISIIPVMKRAFMQLDTARSVEIAGNILQCEMEKERLLGWAQVSNANYVPTIDTAFTRVPSIAGRFTLTRTVAPVPNRSGEMLRITLTVLWRSADGVSMSHSYTTYYGLNGLYECYYNKS